MNELLEAEVSEPKHVCTLSRKLNKFYNLEELKAETPFENAVFGLNVRGRDMAVSWWVSAKRTRSYPYARVYDTLAFNGMKATIIPFVKDEGAKGDRDFLQWDTISLMSLLGIYVILAFYATAKPSPVRGKITRQRFDCLYLAGRFDELARTGLSAHEWNVHEVESKLKFVAEKAKEGYRRIQSTTGVKLHAESGVDEAIRLLAQGVEKYRDRSRVFADKAQRREAITLQPKEHVTKAKKWMIAIRNQKGGYYPWTIDEAIRIKDNVFLIEKKHSSKKKIPAMGDVKDGLLRLIIYSNIVRISDSAGKQLKSYACLGLTSSLGRGTCSNVVDRTVNDCKLNLNRRENGYLQEVFREGKANRITVFYLGQDAEGQEEKVVESILNSLENHEMREK
jgi:uncharacterized pyridoxamine 5'-phosphate oxidase family protein